MLTNLHPARLLQQGRSGQSAGPSAASGSYVPLHLLCAHLLLPFASAGGRAVDALRSVTISQQLLGTTEVGTGRGLGGAVAARQPACALASCSLL